MSSTAINSTNSVPYLTSDRTELAPLCSTPQDTKGLRIIVSFLTVFTVLVSLALMSQLHHGDFQVTPHGTVVSDDAGCSTAGIAVMKKGGNAVDAVISTLFCLSVVLPHLVGIGGGGYLMVYDQRQRQVVGCLDFRPTKGGNHSSIGVPGFVAGLHQAHKLHGKLSWPLLLNAAIEMAGSGFTRSASLLSAIPLAENIPELLTLLNSDHNIPLFDTLTVLAQNGSHELYNGSLSGQMTAWMTAEDLAQYRVVDGQCTQQSVGQYQLATTGPGSGGPLLLHLLDKINETTTVDDPVVRVALALKETLLVSRRYSSGVNVVAVDHNDIYVSAVSGLGSVLGSLDLTKGGYLMNNQMVLGSAAVGEDGRPDTLASPIVVTQQGSACGHRFVMGANDVRDAAQLWLEVLTSVHNNKSLQWALDIARARIFTHQVQLESKHISEVDTQQLAKLKALNFTITDSPEPYPSLNVIHKYGDSVTAVADSRGGGSPASF